MSDLTETANNTKWNVRLGVSNGDVISVANREVTVARVSTDAERKISERPLININLQLDDVRGLVGSLTSDTVLYCRRRKCTSRVRRWRSEGSCSTWIFPTARGVTTTPREASI